ncbi:MAG: MFS transporter [Pseudomonadales bacterium]|nr:MFS transporter [Pseudomonadales bacterium]
MSTPRFYGWTLLAVLSSIYFLVIGASFYGFGVALAAMIKSMGWTRTEAAIGYSIFALSMGIVGPLIALFIQRFNTRACMFIGGILTVSGAMLTFYTESLMQYYLGAGVLMGIGVAMQSFLPCSQLVATWFVKKRALGMGLLMASGGLGAFIVAPSFSWLLIETGNWRYLWLVIAICGAVAAVLAVIFIRENPSDIGQFADGIDPDAISETEQGTENTKATAAMTTVIQRDWKVGEVVRTHAFWIIVLVATVVMASVNMVNSQVVLHLTDMGLTATFAASALGIQGFLSTGGRLLAGSLGDRFDPRKILVVGLFCVLVGILILSIANTTILSYLFASLFGLGFGMAVVSYSTLLANYFGSLYFAQIMSVLGFVSTIIGASVPVLAGFAYDWLGSYIVVFLIISGFAFVSMVLSIVMRPPVHPSTSAI